LDNFAEFYNKYMGCRLQYVSVHQLKYLNYVVRLNVLLSSRFWFVPATV